MRPDSTVEKAGLTSRLTLWEMSYPVRRFTWGRLGLSVPQLRSEIFIEAPGSFTVMDRVIDENSPELRYKSGEAEFLCALKYTLQPLKLRENELLSCLKLFAGYTIVGA